jgi:hypothetical protein
MALLWDGLEELRQMEGRGGRDFSREFLYAFKYGI